MSWGSKYDPRRTISKDFTYDYLHCDGAVMSGGSYDNLFDKMLKYLEQENHKEKQAVDQTEWIKFTSAAPDLIGDVWLQRDQIRGVGTTTSYDTILLMKGHGSVQVQESVATVLDIILD